MHLSELAPTIALEPNVTYIRAACVSNPTTNAKLHVSNQKVTNLPLKLQNRNGRFQVLPIGEGVSSTWIGFQVPELKGGNPA